MAKSKKEKDIKEKKKNNNETKKKKLEIKDYRLLGLIIFSLILSFVVGYMISGILISIACVAILLLFILLGRFLDSTRSKKRRRKIVNIVLIIILIFIIIGMLALVAGAIYIIKESPSFNVNQLEMKQSSILLDSEGNEITKLGIQKRESISYSDLPEIIIDALIATEDSRFFQHNGFDAPRFTKALLGQLAGRPDSGGGSTLSMQVIKNCFTDPDLTKSSGIIGITRKFEDIYLAVFKLEKNFTKEEIIEFYLNNHYLSNGAYGIEQASLNYFGKHVNELNLSEAAMIIGLYKSPNGYNPYYHPKAAQDRRNTVLYLMELHGYITSEEANLARSIAVEDLIVQREGSTAEFRGYIDTVLVELDEKYGIDPNVTSVIVYTNMDRAKQKALDDIFNSKTFKWENDIVQAGVAVVEVSTGKLVAIGAGRDKTDALTLNFAKRKRQIGSTAKPIFDYGPGIEYLGWGTGTIFVDEPHSYTDGKAVNNSDMQFWGAMSLRNALAQSRNIPALKAFQMVSKQAGNKKIVEFATNLGMTPEISSSGTVHEAHSLGAFDGTTPVQMAAAYAAFANGGYYSEAVTINKIVYRDTGDVTTYEGERKKVMSDSTAYIITQSLITSVNSGLAGAAKINGVNVAAKTGTTNFTYETKKANGLANNAINDAWVVGYDPEYSIAMWYGYDKIYKEHHSTVITAANQRKRLFQALGNAIFTKNNQQFKTPGSVVGVALESGTELLASENTPKDKITYEYYKRGTEPTDVSTKYNKLDTVKNLKVTYNDKKEELTITWSKVKEPENSNEEYGEFGYNVYFNDKLLTFTADNSYVIKANKNLEGTYKVVTTYKEYTANQSTPATYVLKLSTTTPSPTPSPSATTTPSPTSSPKPSSTPTPSPKPSPSTSTTPKE